jgi:fructokinase
MGDDELSPMLGTEDPHEAAEMLLGRGAALALISLGPDGAVYATPDFSGHVPAFEVDEILDATGAGDAFLAAALTHLSESAWDEENVREATRRGTVAGAIACTAYGAMSALPTRDELERTLGS